jgi:outer membrane protein W
VRGNFVYDFKYYLPTASVVLGYVEGRSLRYLNLGIGYTIPFSNNKNAHDQIDKGGLGVNIKLGVDYLVSDNMMIGFAGDLRYINVGTTSIAEEKSPFLEYSIGFSMGYQF